jgi:hypothetical protein
LLRIGLLATATLGSPDQGHAVSNTPPCEDLGCGMEERACPSRALAG